MNDEYYMELAILQAKKAYKLNEVPVGAIIVKDGKVISKAYNKKEKDNVSIRHAEIIAIEKACKKLNSWRLDSCVLYTTLEPCMMCMGAIIESRITKVVFGCPKARNYFPGNNLEVVENCKKNECLHLMQKFFENIR